jgi:hypothetical protein
MKQRLHARPLLVGHGISGTRQPPGTGPF